MSATYGSVQLRGELESVTRAVSGWLEAQGYLPVAADSADPHASRFVLLGEKDGWVAVLDEDALLLPEAEALARHLATAFPSPVFHLGVEQSLEASLSVYEGQAQPVRVTTSDPGAQVRDPEGQLRLRAPALERFAASPGLLGKLKRGLEVDATWPEDAWNTLARTLGMLPALASQWEDDVRVLRLAFREKKKPALRLVRETVDSRKPLYALETISDVIDAVAGYPLDSVNHWKLQLIQGAQEAPLVVELTFAGEPLMDVQGLEARLGETVFEASVERSSGGYVVRFPAFSLAAADAMPESLDFSRARDRRLHQDAADRERQGCVLLRVRGVPSRPGHDLLTLQVGQRSAAMELTVRAGPRLPPLPPRIDPALRGISAADALHDRLRDADVYNEQVAAVGWLGFRNASPELLEALLVLLDRMSEAAGTQRLEGALEVNFSYPDLALPWTVGKASWRGRAPSGWLAALAQLRVEGRLELRAPSRSLHVTHEPWSGTGVTRPRRPSTAPHLALGWSLPPPKTPAARRALGRAMDSVLREGAALPGCVGGYAGTGSWNSGARTPYECLAGTNVFVDAAWMEQHLRTPAWRVFLPTAAARKLSNDPPVGVRVLPLASGSFLALEPADPFNVTASLMESLERFVLPVAGTEDEALAFRP